MSQLSNKLSKIHKDIRQDQIKSMMKKVRYQMQRLNQQTVLKEIIQLQNHQFTSYHFQTIIEMVNKDVTNAILHLGNLVIDQVVPVQILENIQWRLGNNQRWTWLINVFTDVGFSTNQMLQYCINHIVIRKSNLNLQNALEALQKSINLNQEVLSSFSSPKLMLALSNHIHESYDRVSMISLRIMTTATSQDETIPQQMINILGEQRITQMLLACLLKIQANYRAMACQIVNNFLLSGIHLEKVCIRLLELAVCEKQKVKLQISYYLKGFAQKVHENMILAYIKKYKLFQILKRYSQIKSANPKYDQQISQNAEKSLQIIIQRFSHNISQNLINQQDSLSQKIEKILEESEIMTLYGDQSHIMHI